MAVARRYRPDRALNAHGEGRHAHAILVNACDVEIHLLLGWSLVAVDRPVIVPPKCFLPQCLNQGVSRETEQLA